MEELERAKWVGSHYSHTRKMLCPYEEALSYAISFEELSERIQKVRAEHPEVEGTEAWLEVNSDEGMDLTFYRPLTPEEQRLRKVNEEYWQKQIRESPRYTYHWVEEESM